MKALGIECTAHTLSIGVMDGGERLSNVIDTYSGGSEGLIPRKMADHHAECFARVLSQSLGDAGLAIRDIGLIAFSQGPGIGAPLSVGIAGAKYLALRHGKPLVGVNHCYAHVKISEHLCNMENPLALYLSGGNSQILLEDAENHYRVLGETLDIGIGNMFDSFARAIKMEQAHGGALSKLAEGGKYLPLPYSVKGMNLVFSGLLTAAEKAARTHPHRDVAYSLMETSFAMTCEVAERALYLTRKKSLVVCGGVAQNRRLQEMLRKMCAEDGVKFGVAPDEFNRDNGAMIAYAGSLLHRRYGPTPLEKCVPITNYRIDRMKEVLG
ncbi:tRNA (adenosine(37)-N6)-threonylcarbamoyltransferase complex transferase subunit TsaD [Candidatus Micrarchaeota archaeon]|nr:tRNA (adenosine(37)-N6)-threonylcarbamoyltransferase complex transferase subunit TsaD [Candidatus Micrarchaeota archaeon]